MNESATRAEGTAAPAAAPLLTDAEQRLLLRLARDQLRSLFATAGREDDASATAPTDDDLPAALRRPYGAFVSLHAGRGLRGCLGSMAPAGPLARTVRDLAVAAATRDPRFEPVRADELAGLQLEISVLGEAEPLTGAGQVRPGRHGLIVARGSRRGVLLPQVAVEQGWDGPTFLSQTCVKAGLPADAWRAWERGEDDDFSVMAFTAQVVAGPA